MTEFFVIMSFFATRQKDKQQLTIKISMDLWRLNNMKVILTPSTLTDSFHVAHNQVHNRLILKNFILKFLKNMIKPLLN